MVKMSSNLSRFLVHSGVFHTPGSGGQTLNRFVDKAWTSVDKTPETLAIATLLVDKIGGQPWTSLSTWGRKLVDKVLS